MRKNYHQSLLELAERLTWLTSTTHVRFAEKAALYVSGLCKFYTSCATLADGVVPVVQELTADLQEVRLCRLLSFADVATRGVGARPDAARARRPRAGYPTAA